METKKKELKPSQKPCKTCKHWMGMALWAECKQLNTPTCATWTGCVMHKERD
jgi:hypothetical protein